MNRTANIIAALALAVSAASHLSAQQVTTARPAPVLASQPLLSILPSAEGLYFPHHTEITSDDISGATAPIGLSYRRTAPVQGIQFTIHTTGRNIRIERVEFGSDFPGAENWWIDYQVINAASGSEVRVIAFGRDTAAAITSGKYNELFRVVYDVPPIAATDAEGKGASRASASMTIGEVSSAIADRFGTSAGIGVWADRDASRITIIDAWMHGAFERDRVDAKTIPSFK